MTFTTKYEYNEDRNGYHDDGIQDCNIVLSVIHGMQDLEYENRYDMIERKMSNVLVDLHNHKFMGDLLMASLLSIGISYACMLINQHDTCDESYGMCLRCWLFISTLEPVIFNLFAIILCARSLRRPTLKVVWFLSVCQTLFLASWWIYGVMILSKNSTCVKEGDSVAVMSILWLILVFVVHAPATIIRKGVRD